MSTQAVQLTDAWSDLFTDTVTSLAGLGTVLVGQSATYPLPNPFFIAPGLAQVLVVNPLTYAAFLLTGQAGDIPNAIIAHINALATLAPAIVKDIPPAILKQIQTPILAVQEAFDFVANATDKLAALLQAPAVFLNFALNSQYGLLGFNGVIAVPIILRNVIANAFFTPPPAGLPFKKAAAATSTPKAAAAETVSAPPGTASSARTKSAAPVVGSRKASSAKAGKAPSAKSTAKSGAGGGQGSSARG